MLCSEPDRGTERVNGLIPNWLRYGFELDQAYILLFPTSSNICRNRTACFNDKHMEISVPRSSRSSSKASHECMRIRYWASFLWQPFFSRIDCPPKEAIHTSHEDNSRTTNENIDGTPVEAIGQEDKMYSCFTSYRRSRDRGSIRYRGMIFWLVAVFTARALPIFFKQVL